MLACILKKIHLFGIYRKICFFIINYVMPGRKPFRCKVKRLLLNSIGITVGRNTTIMSPIHITGSCSIGNNCWVNKNFTIHGNGTVHIYDNCDIAPDVTFLTGGHRIGGEERRAGLGENYTITIEDGCWIGARSTILGNTTIHNGVVIAASACVTRDIPSNTLAGGVPARIIKEL